ncbi:hypothetical protein Ocin01_16864 [Orchesella cincta]|uniref:Uncharacterized protein n=1 Tax=Orchesella cincta TaxID=48709 RepID=A0A1D2MA04_ORCCI|nr:hypothetical protein Ocin01_16864 [Orchesella cincta]
MQKRTSGVSRRSMNNAHTTTRGAMQDPQTYGMLLWQSKLQEKLLEEQKERRKKELEEQQNRIRESEEQTQEQKHYGQQPQVEQQRQADTTPVEIPQMIPGPAPYTVTPSNPQTPISPQEKLATLANGQTSGGLDQPLFPNITRRIRTSTSCDSFGKPSPMLGNIVSFQQMGGAGSPRRTPSGKLLTVLRGDPEIRYHQKDTRGFDQTMRYLIDREKVVEYKRELDQQLEEKRKWRSQLGSAAIKEITRKGFTENGGNNNGKSHTSASDHQYLGDTFVDRISGIGNNRNGMELAPLMRKFNSLPKLNTLGSTDVTRPYVHSPRNEFFHPIQAAEVAETLSSQLREKEWLSRRHQENERLATERHFQTWDKIWGRPGGGAPVPFSDKSLGHAVSFGNLYGTQPQRAGYNRVNLFKAIHMTHQQPSRPK